MLSLTDFAINYLDFWLVDLFTTYPDVNGKIYINLGDISEDVLKDGLLSAENTVPGTLTQTVWGNILPLSNLLSFTSHETINHNNLLDTLNNYFEYTIDIHKESFLYGMNYIVDYRNSNNNIILEDGHHAKSKFYHFRIPLSGFTAQTGTPSDTGHPKFIRIYLTGFSTPVNLRFINMFLSESVQEVIN